MALVWLSAASFFLFLSSSTSACFWYLLASWICFLTGLSSACSSGGGEFEPPDWPGLPLPGFPEPDLPPLDSPGLPDLGSEGLPGLASPLPSPWPLLPALA
jgi:hypothetical protein